MLEIVGIRKNFVNSAEPALDGIDLRIVEGECLALLGPSGCGKTTLLRILAGLETADAGEVRLDGQTLTAGVSERPFHMVFQRHALFPHLNVFENIAFGLRLRKVPSRELKERVREALALVRLQGFEKRRPATLSGGQSQRVALARALVNRPRVLLLDEPFSALDLKLREGMAAELRDLQKQLRLTFIFVTHDQQEAFALSDRVALMRQGRLEQIGTPEEIYQKPQGIFAARFVGQATELPVADFQPQGHGSVRFRCADQVLAGFSPEFSTPPRKLKAVVRPEALHLREIPGASNRCSVTIRDWIFKGSSVLVRAEGPARTPVLIALAPGEIAALNLRPQKTCEVFFRPADTWVCPHEDEA